MRENIFYYFFVPIHVFYTVFIFCCYINEQSMEGRSGGCGSVANKLSPCDNAWRLGGWSDEIKQRRHTGGQQAHSGPHVRLCCPCSTLVSVLLSSLVLWSLWSVHTYPGCPSFWTGRCGTLHSPTAACRPHIVAATSGLVSCSSPELSPLGSLHSCTFLSPVSIHISTLKEATLEVLGQHFWPCWWLGPSGYTKVLPSWIRLFWNSCVFHLLSLLVFNKEVLRNIYI